MINYDLTKIKAIIFDVDGVLSKQTVQMSENGAPLRTVNIRDGYAIQLAVKLGLKICIITGAKTQNIKKRYEGLGVTDIYLASSVKIKDYEDYIWRNRLKDEEVMYMGDDIRTVLPLLNRCTARPENTRQKRWRRKWPRGTMHE